MTDADDGLDQPEPGDEISADAVHDFDSLAAALKMLPSCQKCKKGRRRCDTNLPACNRCKRLGIECLFYDHNVEQVLPRR
jgi:hypothetical protein